MRKFPMELIMNDVGGMDLMVEKDAGNSIRVKTGNISNSVNFWIKLRNICDQALVEFDVEESI